MPRTFSYFAIVATLWLGACAREAPLESKTDAIEGIVSRAERDETPAEAERGNSNRGQAQIMLGGEVLEANLVTCLPGMGASAIATNNIDPNGLPTAQLKVYSEAYGGVSLNTASILYDAATGRQFWQLHEGSISKEGKTFAASGTLKGVSHIEQNDGTMKSVPLDGNDIKPFQITIDCP